MTAQGFIVDLVKDYEGRRDADPSNSNLHYLFGRATGDPTVAEKSFLKALKLDSKNKWALQGLGGVAAVRGDLDAAQGRYEEALAVDPSFVIARNKLAGLHYARGDNRPQSELIRRWMRRQTTTTRTSIWARCSPWRATWRAQRSCSACSSNSAIRLPSSIWAMCSSSFVASSSRPRTSRYLAINPRDRTVAGSLRLAEDAAGSVLEAFAPYEKALSAGSRDQKAAALPRSAAVGPQLCGGALPARLALLALGEADEGIKELRKAVEQSPDDAGLRFNLGTGLMDRGVWQGAEAPREGARDRLWRPRYSLNWPPPAASGTCSKGLR